MSSGLLPGHEPDCIRFYCQTPGCETTWRRDALCPICGQGPGVPGRTGHEPDGWPQLRHNPPAVVPTRAAP